MNIKSITRIKIPISISNSDVNTVEKLFSEGEVNDLLEFVRRLAA